MPRGKETNRTLPDVEIHQEDLPWLLNGFIGMTEAIHPDQMYLRADTSRR